ncbi:hypothetical protein [Flavilitoribacter nigricans]|uniref:Peptidase S74 domain-containing protein n=1 Tax=Flavilitoribacter nigricans (strain ATCC 23147 / DSM 23189 / NBRC 102662 / NCIMB 1420 / SS-2) TaxID=1122177 RepID=A0A2D0NHT7_FLAN2|nr:hypothetical protein [Flavilitoribacter nigricans]PHN07333.1 hypothetical protein CRP01_06800 [Flavilitoribacter nigricans DSM 23189 = NBRC 102662]
MKSFNLSFFIVLIISFFAIDSANAQIYTPSGAIQGTSGNNNIGLSQTSPQSKLSIFGAGDPRFSAYISTNTSGNGVAGLVSELPAITGGADWNRSIMARITSGRGYAVGLDARSYNTAPGAGRSYGLYATAGNATSNYNYGVFSRLLGSNSGTAILGWDAINNPGWNHSTNGSWAGYFVGNVGVDGKVGVNTVNPLSQVSINGDGDTRYGAYVTSNTAGNGVAGLVSELPKITGGADWNRSIIAKIEAGTGYAVGVNTSSYTDVASNQGRSYGLHATAGNATSNYNYGVFSRLRGANAGTAILGWDEINKPTWDHSTNGSWAGYFVGNVGVDGKVGVNTVNPLSQVSINGDGDTRYGAYVTSNTAGNGVAGLVSELPKITGGADWNRSIIAKIEAGTGYAVGVNTSSYTDVASNQGRSYGLHATAGNATSNYNYGVFSRLRGANAGTAILGWDEINKPAWDHSTNGSWAGYFVGDVGVDGKVAIGTNQMPTTLNGYNLSNYKLYVCGGILADELLIPSVSWCDYVFEDTYDLTPLEDVKEHIATKGYLHKTPSAEEVESEGMKIGEITVNQQEKIEEIFLHLIEMNDQLQELKAENASLKTQLEQIRNK